MRWCPTTLLFRDKPAAASYWGADTDSLLGLDRIRPLEHLIHLGEVVGPAGHCGRVAFGLVAFLEVGLLPELAHLERVR